jgi:hypothetical protein
MISHDDAKLGLCGLPVIWGPNDDTEIFAGYVAYQCPGCSYWHQAYDSRLLRQMLAWFPENKVIYPKGDSNAR